MGPPFFLSNSLVNKFGVVEAHGMKLLFVSIFVMGYGLSLLRAGEAGKLSESMAAQCAQQWACCVGQGRADELAKILDDSYQHIHGTGLAENKEEFLGAIRSGARKYEPIQLEEVKTRMFSDCAVVTGKFALKVSIKGKMMEGVNRFSFVVVQTPQGPKIVSFQATAIKPAI
jgi:hypothetical protein